MEEGQGEEIEVKLCPSQTDKTDKLLTVVSLVSDMICMVWSAVADYSEKEDEKGLCLFWIDLAHTQACAHIAHARVCAHTHTN